MFLSLRMLDIVTPISQSLKVSWNVLLKLHPQDRISRCLRSHEVVTVAILRQFHSPDHYVLPLNGSNAL